MENRGTEPSRKGCSTHGEAASSQLPLFEDLEPPPPFGDYSRGQETAAPVHVPEEEEIRRFRDIVYEHYGAFGREFPWRDTHDAYEILVSEIMLQQTQTGRVIEKYRAFLERWPTLSSLAAASMKDVFSLWRGLGYNRRAKGLVDACRKVEEEWQGVLPDSVEMLSSLPMIGRATASAICAFAFQRPVVFLETNIRRVYIYFFFDRRENVRDRELIHIGVFVL